jgi:hypothetical protein
VYGFDRGRTVACFGLVTATVTSFVMQRTEGVHEYSTADLMDAMKEVQTRISRLEDELVRGPAD